jgi:hypothetical protein
MSILAVLSVSCHESSIALFCKSRFCRKFCQLFAAQTVATAEPGTKEAKEATSKLVSSQLLESEQVNARVCAFELGASIAQRLI